MPSFLGRLYASMRNGRTPRDVFALGPAYATVALLLAPIAACEDSTAGRDPPQIGPRVREFAQDPACATQPPPSDAPDASHVEPEDEPGERSVRDLLDWALEVIADGRTLSREEIEQHFAPAFLAQVPEPELLAAIADLHAQLGAFELASVEELGPETLRAGLDASSGRWSVDIEASATPPRQIVALYLRPLGPAPQYGSYEEAIEALRATAVATQLLVAELADGACVPLQTHDDGAHLAIGSAFKLWVLLALDNALRTAPTLSWDSTLPIRDDLKSLASGVLQHEPAGRELSLRTYASQMISISDNTATDHLIEFVGRNAVEQAQLDTGHSAPALNVPWLTTRELFALKLAASSEQIDAYQSASLDEKRILLEQLRQLPIDPEQVAAWRAPRRLEFEWFARPLDLCQVLGQLAARAGFDPDAELLRILALNPGVNFDPSRWTYVGYKGGSEPGVLNLSWLLRRADGRWFSVVITANDTLEPIDEAAVIEVARAVAELLAD